MVEIDTFNNAPNLSNIKIVELWNYYMWGCDYIVNCNSRLSKRFFSKLCLWKDTVEIFKRRLLSSKIYFLLWLYKEIVKIFNRGGAFILIEYIAV